MSEPATCPLCGRSLAGAPSVRLLTGGRCHLACAEAQAAAAWQRRQQLALAHLALVAAALLALGAWSGASPGLLVVSAAWACLHVRLHHRYWHYRIRDLRRALRRR